MAALSIAHAHRVPYAPLHARQHLRHALKGQVAPRHSPGVVSINVAWRPGLTPGPFHRVSEPSHRPPSARLAQEHRRPRQRVRTRGLLPLTGFLLSLCLQPHGDLFYKYEILVQIRPLPRQSYQDQTREHTQQGVAVSPEPTSMPTSKPVAFPVPHRRYNYSELCYNYRCPNSSSCLTLTPSPRALTLTLTLTLTFTRTMPHPIMHTQCTPRVRLPPVVSGTLTSCSQPPLTPALLNHI